MAKASARRAALSFHPTLSRRGGAPAKPTKPTLARYFESAWSRVPAARRPDLSGVARVVLDVIVVDDAEIAELNAAHMQHDGPTDVLSFPMGEMDPERDGFNLGEIVVSFETACREAAARNLSFEEELCRYCVHGFLHLLGYDDSTPSKRKTMFAVQEAALRQ